ncbi:MAG: segregation and condensation protein A [Patescibacteria group bacterium]
MVAFKTEKFEGPLGILLQLIEAEKMDITEIALARIADQFLAYLEQAVDIDSDELADFLVIAAKLLYIKSKALLPYLVIEEEEKGAFDLERQLKMYKEFIDASQKIKGIIANGRPLFTPAMPSKNRSALNPGFYPPAKLTGDILAECFPKIIAKLKPVVKKLEERFLEPKISIEERIDSIRLLVKNRARVNFSQLLKSFKTRTELIVNFLAVLELAKQREIFFEQDELFGEINLVQEENIINT